MMDRLTEMEAFATVVDQGGFTGAARKLNVSKSAISKHVSSLESRLGVRLLNRTTRRVNPTEIGLVYYERAKEILAAAREADGLVGALQGSPEGALRIAAPPDYGRAVLAPRLAEFSESYPAVFVELVLIDRPVELNSEGFDIAVAPGVREPASPQIRPLGDYALELVAAPAYLERAGHPARIEDLATHVLLHGNSESAGVWNVTAPTGEVRAVRARPRIAVNDSRAVRDLVLDGAGIAFLPDYLVKEALDAGRLQRVIANLPEQGRTMLATVSAQRQPNPRIAAFLDMFADGAAGLGGRRSGRS